MGEEVKTEVEESKSSGNSAYSKKSPMKWLLIYLVIGLLVYALVYFFLYNKRNQNTGQMESSDQKTTTSDTGESVLPPEITNVTLTKEGFSPQNVKIKTGEAVTWSNQSGNVATVNSAPHPAHTDFPILNLGEFASGDSFSLVFDTPGTYKYHNHLDPTQFGSVVVE